MTKSISTAALVLCVIFYSTASSTALTPGAARAKYSNCKELNKVYPGGVSKSAKNKNIGGKTTRQPTVNSKVYLENASKDRDKDGIACEK
jgi:hypothetical protein